MRGLRGFWGGRESAAAVGVDRGMVACQRGQAFQPRKEVPFAMFALTCQERRCRRHGTNNLLADLPQPPKEHAWGWSDPCNRKEVKCRRPTISSRIATTAVSHGVPDVFRSGTRPEHVGQSRRFFFGTRGRGIGGHHPPQGKPHLGGTPLHRPQHWSRAANTTGIPGPGSRGQDQGLSFLALSPGNAAASGSGGFHFASHFAHLLGVFATHRIVIEISSTPAEVRVDHQPTHRETQKKMHASKNNN